jgi:hypothetical protein
MSYSHTRVDAIEKATKAYLLGLAQNVETVNAGDPPVPKVDDILVIAPLVNFCAEIRKVNRHVKFGIGKGLKKPRGFDGPNRFSELYVYMDGHTYTMMKIGYADYSIRETYSNKYMVHARTIKNEKFRESNDQYHMALAESVERAVKNAKKYMRPYSPVECANMSLDAVRNNFSAVGVSVTSRLYDGRTGVMDSRHLRTELFHMLDIGYEFLSLEFRDQIVKWRETWQADQEAKSRALHAYYVHVRLHREEMMCDVIEVLDANKRSRLQSDMPVTAYKMEDLPEHIGGNLAALSMVEDGHYVDGLGLRVDSSTFWVQR